MGLNVIPVQGTFDIARGRNILRNQMTTHHWSPTLCARGSALLTAMGELILSSQTPHGLPLEVSILPENQELWMRCTVVLNSMSADMFCTLEERIRRAADHINVNRQLNQACVMAYLYAAKGHNL